MDCQDIQKKLEAFIDGELSPEEGKIISDHLDSCPACQAEWEALFKLDSLMAETGGLDPGEEAWQRMRDGVGRAITPRKVRSRAGILEWLQWLVSPRYVVVKVGAAVAVAVIAVLVSRQMTLEQFSPPSETISEQTISRRDAVETEKAAVREESTIKGTQPLEEPQDEITSEVTREIEPITPKPAATSEKRQVFLPETVVVDADVKAMRLAPKSRDTDKEATMEMEKVEDVGDVLKTLPGVHVDEEGEFHFRGERSREVTEISPQEAKKSQMDISINETQEEMTAGRISSKGTGTSQDRLTIQSETARQLSGESDPILVVPFSPLSYWEEYQVSITAEQEFPTQADSLWHEYDRCEGEPCRLEVIPYLADALFRQALQTNNQETLEHLKPLMETYRERLEDTWGERRYQVRWDKLIELTN